MSTLMEAIDELIAESETGRLIVRREDDLNQHGREGYTLTHTFTITIVDTLQKTIED